MPAFRTWPQAALGVFLCGTAALASPIPVGLSTVSVGYETDGRPVLYSGQRDFLGTSPSAATSLDPASNIRVFQAANAYGRRLNVSLEYPEVLGEGETLISHNFFKSNNAADYFPGISSDGSITIQLESIQFSEPVAVDPSTVMLHVFFDVNQSRLLHHPYHHVHNAHTLTDPFRNADRFFDADEFMVSPPHQVFGDLSSVLQIIGSGTTELDILATIPYSILEHLADENDEVPAGLPAPHGFLEPFHFHIEYVVSAVPEPATLSLLAFGAVAVVCRRFGRSKHY